jgi:hypothetical protein
VLLVACILFVMVAALWRVDVYDGGGDDAISTWD